MSLSNLKSHEARFLAKCIIFAIIFLCFIQLYKRSGHNDTSSDDSTLDKEVAVQAISVMHADAVLLLSSVTDAWNRYNVSTVSIIQDMCIRLADYGVNVKVLKERLEVLHKKLEKCSEQILDDVEAVVTSTKFIGDDLVHEVRNIATSTFGYLQEFTKELDRTLRGNCFSNVPLSCNQLADVLRDTILQLDVKEAAEEMEIQLNDEKYLLQRSWTNIKAAKNKYLQSKVEALGALKAVV